MPSRQASFRTPPRVAIAALATVSTAIAMIATGATMAPAGQAAAPGDAPDLRVYARIRDEGQNRSRVMDYATELIDGIGPRLTGSPNLKKATAWAQERLTQMGLSRVRAESWGEFGVGWEQRNVWMRMIAPDTATLIAYAAPWSPATAGAVSAELVNIGGIPDADGVARFSGRLRGKFVLLGRGPGPPDVTPFDKPLFTRWTQEQLAAYAAPRPGAGAETDPGVREQQFARLERSEGLGRALAAEGVLAIVVPSGNRPNGGISGGTLLVDGGAALGVLPYQKDHLMQVPLVVIANEHYGRIERLLTRKVPVRLELNVDTAFTGDREEGFNVLGDIPGVDPVRRDEVVMLGAHLDSWAAGNGATDDGAGVLIAMEAMRLLRAAGVQPRRTIRIALWSGEEQGALGSLDYVKRYIATVPRATTPEALRVPEFIRRRSGPIVLKPDHARLSAIFTFDAGGGRIRGISVGANPALVALFEQWRAPLEDLGMTMVAARSDCGGDCRPFEEAGIPTPVFRHDPLDYDTRTHHTNMDTYEHLIPEDLRQAAIIAATMAYNTAMRDEMLPRVRP
jgi:hypothetical protein